MLGGLAAGRPAPPPPPARRPAPLLHCCRQLAGRGGRQAGAGRQPAPPQGARPSTPLSPPARAHLHHVGLVERLHGLQRLLPGGHGRKPAALAEQGPALSEEVDLLDLPQRQQGREGGGGQLRGARMPRPVGRGRRAAPAGARAPVARDPGARRRRQLRRLARLARRRRRRQTPRGGPLLQGSPLKTGGTAAGCPSRTR
jgi:hypothetical protein